LGEDGCKLINQGVVEQAVKLGLADPKVVVADMTAQEAAIPYPNEMGLLGGFVRSIEAAAGKAGQSFKDFLGKAQGKFRAAKEQVRKYRLFAKSKTKAAKDRMVAQMTSAVEGSTTNWAKALAVASEQGRKLRVMPWSHGASWRSCTRPWASWCRRFVTGCAPASSPPERSSV